MKNNITELVFILDRSGSMSGLEQDTIGGFNSLIEKQRRQNGKCYVSTVLFDHETEVLHVLRDKDIMPIFRLSRQRHPTAPADCGGRRSFRAGANSTKEPISRAA